MARKKHAAKSMKSKKSATARHEMIDTKTEDLLQSPSLPTDELKDPYKAASFRWGVLVVLFVILGIVYLVNRGYIVAAMVNGKPVFGWELNSAVMSRYGSQTLENMISERLIAETAQKQGIIVSKSEVDGKLNDLVKSLGPNVKIDDVLKYQGVTRSEFENQVRLQLAVEKLLGKDVVVSDADIDTYIAENKETLTATDEAGLREEAKQTLFSQQVSQKIQPWFAELKGKAKIVRLFK
jgi:hypothetical protein